MLEEDEQEDVIQYIALNPKAGVLIKNTGGIRKLRWARKGMGKSGGVRIIYFYYNEGIPIFLLSAYGKGDKANLSDAERNGLAKLTSLLVEGYKKKRGKK